MLVVRKSVCVCGSGCSLLYVELRGELCSKSLNRGRDVRSLLIEDVMSDQV